MIRYHTWLSGLMVHRDEVSPDPMNPNNGDVDEIVSSILVNGCYRPIYAAKETTHVVAGHNLYAALLELGAAYLPVAWLDGDDAQARRILLADNQIARLARMDDTQLFQLLNWVKETDLGFTGTGWNEDLYERQMALANPPPDIPFFSGHETGESILYEHTCPECGHVWRD